MPASHEPRSENAIRPPTSSCSLSKRLRRWAAKDFGPRILRRIARVLTRSLEGFDWKEVAANLQVSDRTLDDAFWSEIRLADTPQKVHSERQDVIQKPQDQHPVNPNSAPSR
jgi:hypothetical protein